MNFLRKKMFFLKRKKNDWEKKMILFKAKRIATYFKNFANTYYTSITKYLFYDLV